MAKKKREQYQFRFYEMPNNEQVIALLGSDWVRPYGEGIDEQHFHNYMEIGICYEGKGHVVIDGVSHEFRPGNLSIIPANIPHNTVSDPNTQSFWEWMYFDIPSVVEDISFFSRRKTETRDMQKALDAEAHFLYREDYPQLYNIVVKIRNECENKQRMYRENVRAVLQSFVVEVLRLGDDSEEENRIRRNTMAISPAIDYVEEHYDEKILVHQLADECGLSESHFRRVFLSYMNMPPVDYVNTVRIRNACDLLEKTEVSMAEVAYKTGFLNVSSFNRNFKKIMGTTPYHWKRSSATVQGRINNVKIKALKGW